MSKQKPLIDTQESVTPIVIDAMQQGPERLRDIMTSFVRHMHDFVREVRPTEEEFDQGIAFLNAIGAATNDSHNEGMIFADVLGISTLVCMLNNGNGGPTESAAALLGPFWRLNQPRTENGGSIIRSPTPGPALFAKCRITDPTGAPISGVEVDVWHASTVGMYDIQDDNQADMNLRGKFTTDADGAFWFRSVRPVGYPIPTHGPSGTLLAAQQRRAQRPAHLHFLAFKEGYKTLISQIFVSDDVHLAEDVTFGVTKYLIGNFQRHTGSPPEPDVTGDWYSMDHTLVMTPGIAALPAPPIA
jgi:protocatechuate 3,4-dioxygenase beta subunit